jgi:hypothetical protein
MSARGLRGGLMLPDDGIIDPIAVELAVSGTRPVALTPAERRIAAASILARGGTPYLISKRLHISGSAALVLAAECQPDRASAKTTKRLGAADCQGIRHG